MWNNSNRPTLCWEHYNRNGDAYLRRGKRQKKRVGKEKVSEMKRITERVWAETTDGGSILLSEEIRMVDEVKGPPPPLALLWGLLHGKALTALAYFRLKRGLRTKGKKVVSPSERKKWRRKSGRFWIRSMTGAGKEGE